MRKRIQRLKRSKQYTLSGQPSFSGFKVFHRIRSTRSRPLPPGTYMAKITDVNIKFNGLHLDLIVLDEAHLISAF